MSLYKRFLPHDRSQKAAGSFVACVPPAGDTLFRVMEAECQLWESRVKSSPGLQRVLCRHIRHPSPNLLLGSSLARIAGAFFNLVF